MAPVAALIFSLIAGAWSVGFAAEARTAATPAPIASSETESNYRLGPGDSIQVFVWRNPELSVTVPVRPDGKISTPLVEDMVAVGKSPSELARDMERVLSEYVLMPKVNIIVMQSSSAASQVKILGQVHTPGSVAFRAGMTVLDAVMAVGGPTTFAAPNRGRLLRKTPQGKEQVIRVRIGDIVEGKLKGNVEVQPGDVIVVPESIF